MESIIHLAKHYANNHTVQFISFLADRRLEDGKTR